MLQKEQVKNELKEAYQDVLEYMWFLDEEEINHVSPIIYHDLYDSYGWKEDGDESFWQDFNPTVKIKISYMSSDEDFNNEVERQICEAIDSEEAEHDEIEGFDRAMDDLSDEELLDYCINELKVKDDLNYPVATE